MGQNGVVDPVERWQTDAAIVVGSALGGFAAVIALARLDQFNGPVVLGGFLAGSLLSFLALSYLLYGR
jgi:hypothetical protein